MISIPGESDSGPGASTPDEPVPGKTHDHPQWRNIQEGWTDADRQHSPIPHQAELFPCHPGCGGKLPVSTQITLRSHLNLCLPHLIGSRTIPQVEACASNLNTNDVFVLKSSNALFVWRGVGASDEELEAANHVVKFLGGSPSQVSEGKEPGECPEIS